MERENKVNKKPVDQEFLNKITFHLRFPEKVQVKTTTMYDLMAWNLTKKEVCEALENYINTGEKFVQTQMRGEDKENPAFECKFKLKKIMFYFKIIIRNIDTSDELLLLISVHPSH